MNVTSDGWGGTLDVRQTLVPAAADLGRLARQISPDAFSRQTPCERFDVRALLEHLTWVVRNSAAAARRLSPPPDDPNAKFRAPLGPNWPDDFLDELDSLGDAWTTPAATEGNVEFAGGNVPARLAASLTLCDLVLHGWDLAKATGAQLTVREEVAGELLEFMRQMAPQGRKMGAFGAEVRVPPDAPPMDQALGLSGRNPHWRPSRLAPG